jgi:outer membrane protein assembly factor BamA
MAVSAACAGAVAAQAPPPPADSATAAPRSTLIPLPVLFYQPETGTGFGALANYYFRPGGARADVPPSDVGGYAIYTTRKQILTSLGAHLYLAGGALRLAATVQFTKFPTKFWGIGNDTPGSAEEDYTPLTLAAAAEAQRQVRRGWFVGGRLQLAHRTLRVVSDSGQLVTGTVPGSADGTIVEGTLLVTHDVRDNTVYPTRGRYVQVGALGAATGLGSDFGYGGARFDLRAYVSPARRHVLALRAVAEMRSGTPPFDLLPQVGGDVLLRGYYQGRFRDRVLVALQAEYRMPVVWRIALVAFTEGGRVAPRVGDLRLDAIKASLGGGLRFLLSPREGLNIRADYGYGLDVGSGGFYLAIGEAF